MPPSTPSIIAPPKTGAATGVTGAYTKCGLVGKGSFGAVFLVRHTKKGGETLIMKEIQTKGQPSSEVKAMKQEIAVLKHIRHPNIVGYHSTFEEGGLVCILMEYASRHGAELGNHLCAAYKCARRLRAVRPSPAGRRWSRASRRDCVTCHAPTVNSYILEAVRAHCRTCAECAREGFKM